MNRRPYAGQRGAALVVGLIMLALITLMIIAAMNLGATNFRAVGNAQYRQEAVSAANKAIDEVISSDFTADPAAAAQPIGVDVNNDNVDDYIVHIAQPQCIRATPAFSTDPSSLSLPVTMSVAGTWNTVWNVSATVNSAENPGSAAVNVQVGVRVLLSDTQKQAVCP